MRALAWISGIVVSIFVILLSLYFAITVPAFDLNFYSKEYDKYSIAEAIKIEKADLMAVTSHMVDYLMDVNDDLSIEIKVDGVTRNFFNQKEIDHMVDVKELFTIGRAIRNTGLCVIALFLAAVIARKGTILEAQAKANVIVIGVLTLVLVILGLFIFIDFDGAFNIFHEIFFNNDLWQLNPDTDLLINIVPQQFFIDITKQIAGYFIFCLAATAVSSILYLYLWGKAKLRRISDERRVRK